MDFPRIIALRLFVECDFRHGDGKFYRDDALDTWACLYADLAEWEEVEQVLISLFGEQYAQVGFVAHYEDNKMNPYRTWIYEQLHD